MRLFIGIKPDVNLLKEIVKVQENLKKQGFLGNYTDVANIHLTLLFIGEVNKEIMDKIKKALDKVEFTEFSLEIKSIKKLKDMYILEVKNNQKLSELQAKILKEINDLGFDFNSNYYPHITLVRNITNEKEITNDVNISSSIVTNYILFDSRRINNKLVYRSIYIKKAIK